MAFVSHILFEIFHIYTYFTHRIDCDLFNFLKSVLFCFFNVLQLTLLMSSFLICLAIFLLFLDSSFPLGIFSL